MRRDVRMGFGVGGVLLAVIIVAVLVFHRNHNKAVAFDTNGKPAQPGADQGGLDVTAPPAEAPRAGEQPSLSATNAPRPSEPKVQQEGASAQDQWDALFASSAADPVKSQLRKRNSRRQAPTDPQPSDPPAAELKTTADPVAPAANSSAADAPASQSGTTARTHTVQRGETLSSIAKAVYGEARQYKAILAANPGLDATKMRPGTVLQLPPVSKVKQSAKSADAASAVSDSKNYVVQQGDSLYKITRKLYGTGERQDELYQMNKQVIGPDSTRLKPGMVLKLPAAPTAQQ